MTDQEELFGSLWRAPLVWLMLNVLRFVLIVAFRCAAARQPRRVPAEHCMPTLSFMVEVLGRQQKGRRMSERCA